MARRLAVAGVVGIALLAAGCGENSRAKAVSQYIEDVNAIQHDLRRPLADVAIVSRELQTGAKLESQRQELKRSATTLQTLERRLDRLQPPADARRLDSLMRQAVHAEWELADELALTAGYARESAPPLARAATAQRRVRAALAATKKPAAQAAALDVFADALDSVARRLGRLNAPPAIDPQQRTNIRMFERMAASARALATAIRRRKDTAKPLHELQVAAASASSTAAQRARIAAVVAYNGRVKRITRLLADAQRERTRLQRTL